MKSKYIFSSNVLEQRFPYKLKKQIYISLNYFATSLKSDKPRKSYKWPVEYVASTSLLSSQIISNFSLVPLDNFKTLGFPRNDNILKPRFSREQLIKMLNVSFKIEKIIIHTPTHRMGHNIATKKDVVYYEDSREELCGILNKHNAFLIIVSHPSEQLLIDEGKNDRIALYKPNFQYTLYDLIPHADALITDYTTVYYDFLLTNKPVIFNFYDKEIYEKERGFAFDPIENICAGTIVKNKEELFNAIQQTLTGVDEHKQHRKFVTSMIHKYVDCNSSERIFNFCKTLFNQ
jgi:CDP-glycerol glycerophosphotransferase (TagB/SpsB family)